MLSQQLKSMHSLHLEDVDESSSATPSNTVANNGYYDKRIVQISKTDCTTTELSPRTSSFEISKTDSNNGSLCSFHDNLSNFSQSTRFRFGSDSTVPEKFTVANKYGSVRRTVLQRHYRQA